MSETGYRMSVRDALDICGKIFESVGVPPGHAALLADNLVQAEMREIGSHGLSRVMVYCQRISSGTINLNPDMQVLYERGAALALDGANGLGVVVGTEAMRRCIGKAKESGIAICTVNNSNHFGIAAYYAMMAVNENMIGLTFSNAPPTMAPWGGMAPMLGTNPFCIAVPAMERLPLVLDCATSVVARGKISLAEIEGAQIPDGWAMDAQGSPTNDATAALAGSVLPFGTYKGSGISIMVDVLCGLLSGAAYGTHIGNLYGNSTTPQNLGHCFCAIDLSYFGDPLAFRKRVDAMIIELKNSSKAPGVEEIYMPGEKEFISEDAARRDGFVIGPGVLRDLKALCKQHGLDVVL